MSNKHINLSVQACLRLEAGELILRDYDNNEIVDILGVSLSSVRRWRKALESGDLCSIVRKPQSGRPRKLDDAKRLELKKIICKGACASGYMTDRWTSRIIADLIRKK